MSRIGKQPIAVPDKATVSITGRQVTIKGPKGSLTLEVHPDMTASLDHNQIVVARPSDLKKHRALHGLTRALLHNMVVGVTQGFTRELEIVGVGYRAENRGRHLVMYLGYSHPVVLTPPEGVTVEAVPKEGKVRVSGIDKQLVGQVAAKIRSFRKPEPYKGKGVRYAGEHVRTKAGKTAG
ncbi:MAG TPA: 50S ribosomal protein L6 [candidate division Zixibacteria bacterium]|nr:50S ribosomal protein L6 [candidate division Zixibacteria bacterium]MDD4918440.1 50S ribosomal protein L6 [candidate division Zixibacteria bacterium]MDM7971767.1 50S ribosomal protein L6 [candidate division Zixibacteria bacterium]HOD67537.1 50S ribosomal protein L6 [candidate division Zixibacteria bacterium]HOZ07677.1 50S ribosomal protein L6 [candidate division Zixibacteria bacterium]